MPSHRRGAVRTNEVTSGVLTGTLRLWHAGPKPALEIEWSELHSVDQDPHPCPSPGHSPALAGLPVLGPTSQFYIPQSRGVPPVHTPPPGPRSPPNPDTELCRKTNTLRSAFALPRGQGFTTEKLGGKNFIPGLWDLQDSDPVARKATMAGAGFYTEPESPAQVQARE